MKNQYFGDRRDLFKYDLWLTLARELSGVRALTLVPMLTADDASGEGALVRYEVVGRSRDLHAFLQGCVARRKRAVTQLRQFLRTQPLAYHAYADDQLFAEADRGRYFASIPDAMLSDAVVLVDPDTGLQTGTASYMRRRGSEKYLHYADVAGLLARLEGDSILLIYQHLQQNFYRFDHDTTRQACELARLAGLPSVPYVREHDLAFLAVARDARMVGDATEVLARYAARHGLVSGRPTTVAPVLGAADERPSPTRLW